MGFPFNKMITHKRYRETQEGVLFCGFLFFPLHNCWRQSITQQHKAVNELSPGSTAVLSVLHVQRRALTTNHLGCPDGKGLALYWTHAHHRRGKATRLCCAQRTARPPRCQSASQAMSKKSSNSDMPSFSHITPTESWFFLSCFQQLLSFREQTI